MNFETRQGQAVQGVSKDALLRSIARLTEEAGVSYPQICEAASYSMAMVVRTALGLSGADAETAALVTDSLPGWVGLCTARHLINAGTHVHLVGIDIPADASAEFQALLKPLQYAGLSLISHESAAFDEQLAGFLGNCHNVICGLYNTAAEPSPTCARVVQLLNEIRTPVHTVMSPLFVHPDSGERTGPALYASSTLSLGVPLKGLVPGNDYAGRHYLCDISMPPSIYRDEGVEIAQLFAEQPVVQIFPASA